MKTLDRSQPFATVVGIADHRYEQDGKRFDRDGACMDEPGYKGSGAAPAREVRTTTQADPSVIEQLQKQTGGTVVGSGEPREASEEGGNAPSTELEVLGLNAKTMAALRGSEIQTVEALTACTEAQLIALPNIGEGTVKAIKKALKGAGKKLAG